MPRMINEAVLTNAHLTDLPIPARYLWVALLLTTDDHGRVCIEPAHVRATVFCGTAPGPKVDRIRTWLGRFKDCGMLTEYEFAGRKYAKITNFTKWQRLNNVKPSGRETPGKEQTEEKGKETTQQKAGVGELPLTDGWADLERRAQERSDVDNPGGFVAHLRRKYETPEDALRSLRWDEPEPEDEWAAQFAAQQRRADERARQDEGRPLTTFHGQYRPSSGRSEPMPS